MLATVASLNSFALIGDSGKIGYVYISNSSNEDVILVAADVSDKSGFSGFKCLYQIPKEYQILPSPSFNTMMDPTTKGSTNSMQYAMIRKGSTVAYAFKSTCDDGGDKSHRKYEVIAIRSANNYQKFYTAGRLYQDINNGVIGYNDLVRVSALTADVHSASGTGIRPLQITVLKHEDNLGKNY